MPNDEYTHLSNDELAVLRDAAVRLTTIGEPLLNADRLPANDWQMPLDSLHWLAYKLGVVCEARGLLPSEAPADLQVETKRLQGALDRLMDCAGAYVDKPTEDRERQLRAAIVASNKLLIEATRAGWARTQPT